MRKLLCVIVALVACLLAVTVVSAEETTATVPTTCAAGCENPVWTPLPSGNWNLLEAGHYHYYLTGNDTGYRYTPNPNKEASSTNSANPVTICLDLNGYNITTVNGRSLGVYKNCVLNIMDSSEAQTGYIQGQTGNNATVGGTFFNYGTINLYSGTLRYVYDGVGTNQAYAGGVLAVYDGAAFNMYGGRVEGGQMVSHANTKAGTIYAAGGSAINILGGDVISGTLPDGYNGPCAYLEGSAQLTLSGAANVDNIYLSGSSAKLNINGTYSGKARVTTSFTASNGKVLGTGSNTPAITGDLMCTNGDGWLVNMDGSNVVLATFTPTDARHYCQHCKDIVYWEAMTSSNYKVPQTTSGTYHYYLTGKLTKYVISGGNSDSGIVSNLCLDLKGNTIQPSSGRALLVWGGSTLNLMDSVGTGEVIASTGSSNASTGGTMTVSANGIFNMYGGTMIYNSEGSTTYKGGVIYVSGSMNMYGGTIAETTLNDHASKTEMGPAIALKDATSSLHISGGTVEEGTLPDGGVGPCIYTAAGKLTLTGNPTIANIYTTSKTNITVSDDFAGTATITYSSAPELGEEVGISDNATISGSLTCTNTGHLIVPEDDKLITAIDAPVVVVDGETETGYATLQEAISGCTSGYVKLLNNFDEDVTVSKNVTVDLNGFQLTGTITLSEGAVLYGMDSQTDDYTVEDGNGYGLVTDTAKITAAEGYLPVTEDGKVSFHKITVKITAMTLRPNEAGIYYKSSFLGDEKVADAVESFGVALSIQGTPTEDNLETQCKYSDFPNFEAGAAGNASTSTVLKGILKDTNNLVINRRNMNMQVFGRPYIKTADGYIFGNTVCRNLSEQLKDIDESYDTLNGTQRVALHNMYETFQSVLQPLSLSNTVAGIEEAEDTLSILMVGNSFCYYYVEELYGMLMANPDPNRGYDKVEIYNLYASGCTLTQHYTWWLSGAANYEGFYLTNENGRQTLSPANGGKWNLEMTLQQGCWDYISLQGASTGNDYANGDRDTICASISSLAEPLLDHFHSLFPDAQLLWHRTWPFEIGRVSGSTTYDEALLVKYNAGMQAACDYMCNEFDQDQPYDLMMVNSGAAWVIAREENAKLETSLIPEEGGLCARKGIRNEKTYPYYTDNANAGDGYHDGDIGGGQFLNACVWYETITGQSILENTYRPTTANGKYELSEDFAALLRNAAHAVGTIEEE